MEELRTWLPIIIQIVATIVTIIWFFAKLDKKITVLEVKFENICQNIKEIKENHLAHLAMDVKELGQKLERHLENHD